MLLSQACTSQSTTEEVNEEQQMFSGVLQSTPKKAPVKSNQASTGRAADLYEGNFMRRWKVLASQLKLVLISPEQPLLQKKTINLW